MQYVKFIYEDGRHRFTGASNIEMAILGCFLATDVGCYSPTFREWALADKEDVNSKYCYSIGGNITYLEEEEGYVFLADRTGEDSSLEKLKMTVQQFVQLLDDWRDKVCSIKPREVIVKYEDDQFVIETSG